MAKKINVGQYRQMDLEYYFTALVEDEYDNRREDGEEEAMEWVNNYHKTEYDTADYCTEFLDGYVSNETLKEAILGTVPWEKIWKSLMSHIEDCNG
jgi:hypothetical protein